MPILDHHCPKMRWRFENRQRSVPDRVVDHHTPTKTVRKMMVTMLLMTMIWSVVGPVANWVAKSIPNRHLKTESSSNPKQSKRWVQTEENSSHPIKSTTTVSYALVTPPIVRTYLPEQAAALGVPCGPLYRKLKAGHSVAFVDASTGVERTIHSHQVTIPGSPRMAVLILHYTTTTSYLFHNLIQTTDCQVHVVFHLTMPALWWYERRRRCGRTTAASATAASNDAHRQSLEGQLYFDKKNEVHRSTTDQKSTFKVKIWRKVQKGSEKSSTEYRKRSMA